MRKLLAIIATAAVAFGIATVATAPAQAASTSPTILAVSNKTPLPAGGQNVILTGTNLNVVTSVLVDKSVAQVVSQVPTKLVFITPEHLAGRVGITLIYGTKKYVYGDSMVYKAGPTRALVPLPYIPDTLKVGASFSMVPGNPAWATTVVSKTPLTCTVDASLNVTGVKKGTCLLAFSIVLDTLDRTYRGRDAVYDVVIN
ncbi:MAG: IPT/TIG domain-containing protein [Micrococcales bacterium]